MPAQDVLALYAIIAIWALMLLNIVLAGAGFLYYLGFEEDPAHGRVPLGSGQDYPFVTIMVPAHNEAVVIVRTVNALLDFDYPPERYEVIVINDNSSDDSAARLKELQDQNPGRNLVVINTDAKTGGKGKSNALNIALRQARGTVISIYDADNTPERGALRLLVENLVSDPKAGAVIGKFRTRNRDASLLTRFVNIETIAYQVMAQGGRSRLLGLCTIPGTNYVIRRSIIDEMGGWDVKALSEDTEISFRLYRMGYYIGQVPAAVTWEQEPQALGVWFRQRTRWAKGNIYVIFKNFRYLFDRTAGKMRFDVLYYSLTYVVMLSALVISDSIFLLGLLGLLHVTLGGFSTMLWVLATVAFEATMMLTLSTERNEWSLQNAALVLLMLFTYSKLWGVVVVNAIWQSVRDKVEHREVTWVKTPRVAEGADSVGPAGRTVPRSTSANHTEKGSQR